MSPSFVRCITHSVDHKSSLLVHGYINAYQKEDKQFPTELMNLCMLFYHQTMPRYRTGDKCVVDPMDNTFTTDGSTDHYVTYVIFQVSWNKGIHELRFECIDGLDCCYSIGIVSNKNANPDSWLFDHKEANVSYQLYSYHDEEEDSESTEDDETGIYFHNYGTRKWFKPTKYLTNGCIVSLVSNFNDWTIRYFIDGAEICDPIEIEQNITYYPAIAYNTYAEYQDGKMKSRLLCCTSFI